MHSLSQLSLRALIYGSNLSDNLFAFVNSSIFVEEVRIFFDKEDGSNKSDEDERGYQI